MDLRRLPGLISHALGSLEKLLETRETTEFAWFPVDDLRQGDRLTIPLVPWPHPKRYQWMRNPGFKVVDVKIRHDSGRPEVWALISRPQRTLAIFDRGSDQGVNR
jgi:hypothetical protein